MIRHIITDIDGTLTPGRREVQEVTVRVTPELTREYSYPGMSKPWLVGKKIQKVCTLKQFHCRDTEAAFLLRQYEVQLSILTSSQSNFKHVQEWAKEAHIDNVMYINGRDRVEPFKWLGEEAWNQICFIGDSYVDEQVFDLDIGGFCPQDAASILKTHPNVITLPQDGGNGVLMEAFLWLVKRNLISKKTSEK